MTGVELFTIGSQAVTLGQVASVASTVFSAFGAISNANAQASSANYNAALNRRNAVVARQQAAEDEKKQRILAAKTIGSMRAGYGASGITLEGSPLDLLEESAFNAEMDAQTIRYNGKLASMGYKDSAVLDRMRAKSATKEGYVRAGSSLLLGSTDLMGSFGGEDMYGQSSGYDPSSGAPRRKPVRY